MSKERERLQAALSLIPDKPEEARRQLWTLFKDLKKPEVRVETVRVRDEAKEYELSQEVNRLHDKLQSALFQLEQLRLALEQETMSKAKDKQSNAVEVVLVGMSSAVNLMGLPGFAHDNATAHLAAKAVLFTMFRNGVNMTNPVLLEVKESWSKVNYHVLDSDSLELFEQCHEAFRAELDELIAIGDDDKYTPHLTLVKGNSKMRLDKALHRYVNGRFWVFFVFDSVREDDLFLLLDEAGVHRVVYLEVPKNVLWNREACKIIVVPKAKLSPETLSAGLRTHLGYPELKHMKDIFTLGIKPEDDAAMDRPGFSFFAK
jgi:hypothetical protein